MIRILTFTVVILSFLPTVKGEEPKGARGSGGEGELLEPYDIGSIRGGALQPSAPLHRSYTVECRVVSRKRKKTSFDLPKVTVMDRQKGLSVFDLWKTPFVVAMKSDEGSRKAVVAIIDEGTKVSYMVSGISEREAVVDLTIDVARIDGASSNETENGPVQKFQVNHTTSRIVETALLGTPITAKFADQNGVPWVVEVKVSAALAQ